MTWLRIALPAGTAIAILVLVIMWQSAASRADQAEKKYAQAAADLDAERKRANQLEQTALQRLADQATVDAMGRIFNDAIDAAPGGAPGASTVALGCERLRRAGATSDTFKRICSGRQGGH
ncbi:hypothetical protein [Sphingomonas sp.]|uniref:hypothetical protein n=1 Tax=Sphingomonas sp. TaxID=28214 RepID=UPI0025794B69|nr:hypothetical protein [Sphingomonas sp.]